jgi:hypothetical protein
MCSLKLFDRQYDIRSICCGDQIKFRLTDFETESAEVCMVQYETSIMLYKMFQYRFRSTLLLILALSMLVIKMHKWTGFVALVHMAYTHKFLICLVFISLYASCILAFKYQT